MNTRAAARPFARLADALRRARPGPGWVRRARLGSGLVLFAYVVMHLTAHSFGLSSLEAQSAAGDVVAAVWGFAPVNALLYAALLVHAALALHLVAERRRLFVFRGAEARGTWQLWLGLSLPLILASHVVANRWGAAAYDLDPSYEFTLASTFAFQPWQGVLLAVGLVVVWLHAVLGIDQWLRFRPWFTGWRRETAIAVAVALPLAALAGYLFAGRETEYLVGDPEWLEGYTRRLGSPDEAVFAALGRDVEAVRLGFLAALGAALGGRWLLLALRRRSGAVEIDYQDGPKLRVAAGPTLLDISREGGVPHASVCGGRGRCSTCRVRVRGADPRPPQREADELRLLERAYRSGDDAAVPSDVRLACRWRPKGHVRVARLLPAEGALSVAAGAPGRTRGLTGEERRIAVMFADLRGFTTTSEGRLPFDTVYLINAFARMAGEAIEQEGGRVDKFLGDGVMALFGARDDERTAAARALRAAHALLEGVDALSERLAADLDGPLGVAIGLHHGPAIVGDLGPAPGGATRSGRPRPRRSGRRCARRRRRDRRRSGW